MCTHKNTYFNLTFYSLNKLILACLFAFAVMSSHLNAQALDTQLPDSLQLKLKNTTVEHLDEVYISVGEYYYSKFTDIGFATSLEYYLKSLSLADKYKHVEIAALASYMIGTVYDALKVEPEKMLKYYLLAYKNETEPNAKSTLLYNIAHAYNLLKDSLHSTEYVLLMKEGKKVFKDDKDIFEKISLLEANMHLQNGNIPLFLSQFETVNKTRPYINGRFPYKRIFTLCNWQYLHEKGYYLQAVQYLKKELGETTTDSSLFMENIVQSYQKLGDTLAMQPWQNALKQYESTHVNDSLKKAITIKLLQAYTNVTDKENTILSLQNKATEQKNSFLLYLLLGVALATGVTGYFWYANYRSKLALAQRNAEKAVLIEEMQHRVKNNLQLMYGLAKRQLPNIEDDPTRQLWKKNMAQIQSMALVHEKFYLTDSSTATFDLRDFVLELLQHFETIHSSDAVIEKTIEIAANIKVKSSFLVPFGLIATELFTNSYKHAFGNGLPAYLKINISIQEENQLIFRYADSGVIEEKGVLHKKTTGGTALIKDLTQQLKGKLLVNSSPNLEYYFIFPN
jgi:two-component sensor histidine kinase